MLGNRTVFIAMTATLMCASGCGDDKSADPEPMPADDGLLVDLPFDSNAQDRSGNGNHGTLVGGATASGELVLGDNATDMLSLPFSVMDGLGDFTFAAWLRLDVFRNEGHEVISGANAADDNHLVFWYREHTDEWAVGVNNGNLAFAVDATIEDGQWHHIALVRSGTEASLFQDGAQLGGSVTVGADVLDIDPGGLIFGQDQDVVGGGFAANESWAGAMDDLRIYDRALDATAIQGLAAARTEAGGD